MEDSGSHTNRHGSTGFSLIELLVVIGVIAVICAIALPSLWGARRQARSKVSLANLHGHIGVMMVYAADNRDAWPTPSPDPILRITFKEAASEYPRFAFSSFWNYILADSYYNGQAENRSFYPPDYVTDVIKTPSGFTPYTLTCTAIANAEFWNPKTRTGPDQWGGAKHSDVLYPAKKSALINIYPAFIQYQNRLLTKDAPLTLEIALVDGSAKVVGVRDTIDGYSSGERLRVGTSTGKDGTYHASDWPFGCHTIEGMRGRDVP